MKVEIQGIAVPKYLKGADFIKDDRTYKTPRYLQIAQAEKPILITKLRTTFH